MTTVNIKKSHSRRKQATEYYEWKILTPVVVVQRYGERWFLGIRHVDSTWQVAAYYDTLTQAETVAIALSKRYRDHPLLSTTDQVCLATSTIKEYAS